MAASPSPAEVIPLSLISLTRAQVREELLSLCSTPEQHQLAEHMLLDLDGRGPGTSQSTFRLTLLIAQAVAMLGAFDAELRS